ncbi:MAG: hypothetical protein ABIQ12_00255 [Opitutaceae bacterium]
MRLLSFLSDIESSLIAESPAAAGRSWEVSRMVNFHHGLARLTLKPATGNSSDTLSGTVFLQSFTLADGSLCLKTSLNWKGSDALSVIAVYSTPGLNWKNEATRIAMAWLQGPPSEVSHIDADLQPAELQPLVAMAS